MPTPQILEEIVEAISAPHERVQKRTVEHRIAEQNVDVPTPQTLEEIVEVEKAVKKFPQERISEGIGEQVADAPAPHSQPQILKEVVEVVESVQNFPQERISEWICEQIDVDLSPVDKPGDGTTDAKSVDGAPELKACTTWIMPLVQRKTRAERQGKHKAVLKLRKEIAKA